MKYLLFLSLLIGCSTPRHYTQMSEQVAEYGIQKIKDTKTDVVCYIYRDNDTSSLSCVELSKGKK